MNRTKLRSLLIALIVPVAVFAQENEKKPSVQDLDFLIGTWDITFKWYDTHLPGSEPEFSEVGVQVCEYDLDYRGKPSFVICRVELQTDSGRLKGRTREVLEAIRYSRFSECFERTGLYSNWPATGFELLSYDEESRRFVIRGELGVQGGMLEQYEDTCDFNEDYTYFDRRNVANFSDMPASEYNLTMTGTGKKRK